ncbi:hypothetical protein EC973_005196 [Apophysomyces ossiformis]|uniref:beta-glucosidase n=1 Tax=Apophysomyces ossiformis TaxID=679940 RepID=A0A8H7BZL6_9FUNG|nr:hypothetical protein EC973_005196 [Apophysomyces ossiformis]
MVVYKKQFFLAVAILAFMYLVAFLVLSLYSIRASTFTLLSWDEAYAKADQLVNRMSLEQKVNITTGIGWANGPCVGGTPAIHDPEFPSLCLNDGPMGIRFGLLSSTGVAGINAAASFDKLAIYQRGVYMGNEFRRKGIHAQLGPSMNLMRVPNGGRGWEGFGEDPYLSGVAAAETIRGTQSQGVMAVAKHFVGNEQEYLREQQSTEMDERTLREVYAWPFARSIEAGVASVMCSYNLFRGIYACENDHLMNKVLKKDLAFKGFIQSDWCAVHSTAPTANGGLDMNMPGDYVLGQGGGYFGEHLVYAVKTGAVLEDRINDMVRRIVAAWYKLGQDKGFPETNLDVFRPERDMKVNVQDDHHILIRHMGAISTVLLRNTDTILPLQSELGSISLFGSDAGPNPELPVEAIQKRASSSTRVTWLPNDWDLKSAANTARDSDIAIVFAQADSGEEFITVDGNHGDRKNLSLWHNGDELVGSQIHIRAVADANKNTIVVIHSVGAVLMPWADHPNIKAILWPGLPGQESGNSLADVLFGDVNPSARLPFTIAKKEEDYPAKIINDLVNVYAEGIFVGYRWFDARKINPLFEFGFGLSYTKFFYSDLHVQAREGQAFATLAVENVGERDGAEVVQAYIEFPEPAGEPPKILRGFEKVFLTKGTKAQVQFTFGRTELSYWANDSWVIPAGQFVLHIGARQVRKDRKNRERAPASPLVQIEGLPMTATMEDIRKLARESFPQGDKSIREICFRRTPEFNFTGTCVLHMTSPEAAKSIIDYAHRRLLGGNLMKANYVNVQSGDAAEALRRFRSPELMSVADPTSAASRSVVIVGFPRTTTPDVVMGYLRTKNFFPIEGVPDSVVQLKTKSMAAVSKFLVKFDSESEAWRCVRAFHNTDYNWNKHKETLKLRVSVVY